MTREQAAEHAKKYDEETMTTMAQMQSLYNYNHSLYTLHQNEKKVRRLLVLLQSVSAIAILLLAVALFLLRRKRKKDRELLILSAEVRRMQKELIEYGSREERHLQEENRRSEEMTASIREKPADDEVFSLELITGCSEHKEQIRLLKRTSGYSALTKKRIARKLSKEL